MRGAHGRRTCARTVTWSVHCANHPNRVPDGALLYVGSFDKQQPAVYALDLLASPGPKGKRVVRTFRHPSLLHPTGMLVHRGMLYVLEQTSAGMLKFHATSTEFVSTVLSNLPDAPEGILLVDEC